MPFISSWEWPSTLTNRSETGARGVTHHWHVDRPSLTLPLAPAFLPLVATLTPPLERYDQKVASCTL